ncbi:EARLY FLOWERING 4-like protein [Drosera capensis]
MVGPQTEIRREISLYQNVSRSQFVDISGQTSPHSHPSRLHHIQHHHISLRLQDSNHKFLPSHYPHPFLCMTIPHPISAVGSPMQENSSNGHNHDDHHHHRKRRLQTLADDNGGDAGSDPAVWSEFERSFSEVQTVLDRNRVLIQQVNENQRSRIADNLVKNVRLIQEINGNIGKVLGLYSDLSESFSGAVNQRRGGGGADSKSYDRSEN